jgi:argonaute-like protein implicated in RNA metabolism and viral defense
MHIARHALIACFATKNILQKHLLRLMRTSAPVLGPGLRVVKIRILCYSFWKQDQEGDLIVHGRLGTLGATLLAAVSQMGEFLDTESAWAMCLGSIR